LREVLACVRWRHFLLGRRSHRADLYHPIDLCQGALPLGHVFVEASTTRGHDEFADLGATLPQLRAKKVVFVPDFGFRSQIGIKKII